LTAQGASTPAASGMAIREYVVTPLVCRI
jgi:hypothetical protein